MNERLEINLSTVRCAIQSFKDNGKRVRMGSDQEVIGKLWSNAVLNSER